MGASAVPPRLPGIQSENETPQTYHCNHKPHRPRVNAYTAHTHTLTPFCPFAGSLGGPAAELFAKNGYKVSTWTRSRRDTPGIKSYAGGRAVPQGEAQGTPSNSPSAGACNQRGRSEAAGMPLCGPTCWVTDLCMLPATLGGCAGREELEAFLGQLDALVVLLALTPETQGIVDAK